MSPPGSFDIYQHLTDRPGAAATCPSCRGVGSIAPDDELGMVCSLCGAPRIPTPDGAPLPDVARASLIKADDARKRRGLLRALGLVGITGAVFGVVVGLPLLFLSPLWALVWLAAVDGPSLATYFFTRSARQAKTKEIAAAIDAAWSAAAAEAVRSGRAKDAAGIAKALGVDATRAQQLYAMLAIDAEIGGVRIDTGDDGPKSTIAPDPRFAALEEKARAAAAPTPLKDPEAETEAQAEAEAEAEAEVATDEKAQGHAG